MKELYKLMVLEERGKQKNNKKWVAIGEIAHVAETNSGYSVNYTTAKNCGLLFTETMANKILKGMAFDDKTIRVISESVGFIYHKKEATAKKSVDKETKRYKQQ